MRQRILAHRGLWRQPAEKNSPAVLRAALERGFGLETDIRDLDGQLVISHDPPRSGQSPQPVEELFDFYRRIGAAGWLALNIKADGLAAPLNELAETYGIERAFVFDMSVPDMRGWRGRFLRLFTRRSDVETVPVYFEQAAGAWVDNLENDGDPGSWARSIVTSGKIAALVSPELHGRPYLDSWASWKSDLDPEREERIMVCTDFPEQAVTFFGAEG